MSVGGSPPIGGSIAWAGSYADTVDFAAEYAEQNQAFANLIFGADLAAEVPTCPGWTLKQLFRHVGGGNRWSAQIVGDQLQDRLAFTDIRDGRAPSDLVAARRWFDESTALLIDAVADAGAHTAVWTFIGPRPASWWLRRRLHEVLVHRADAAIAVGADFTTPAELAADSLSEWLDIVTTLMPHLAGKSVHLHATDEGLGPAGEWTIEDGRWTHAHGKGDVALRGPATDLLLVVTRRRAVGDTAIEVFGDEAVLATWLDATKF